MDEHPSRSNRGNIAAVNSVALCLSFGLASEAEQIAGTIKVARTNTLEIRASDHRSAETASPSAPEVIQ
jgi:hypothetical protein